ncbi:MAG: hypothetical protein ACXVIY_06525 [Mucilaginibacter sp.]
MGLFSIFKKKAEPETVAVPSDSIKALPEGILFENEEFFLKWGSDIEADKRYAKKEYRADRTIYQWGERVLLNGIQLPLKTVCWNHKQHGDIKAFESIEFTGEGNEAAGKFQAIKDHITGILGEPKQHEDLQPGEVSLEWKVKAVKVSLNFFNKEHPKVHFEVGWWL